MCAHLSKVWDRNGTTGLTLQQLAHVLAPVLLRRDEQKPERTEAIKRQKCAAQLLTLPWASPKKRDIVTRARGHWSTVKAARRAASNSNPVARRSLKVTWKKGQGPSTDALLASAFAQFGRVSRAGRSARNSGVVMFDDSQNRDAAFKGYEGPWTLRKADSPKPQKRPPPSPIKEEVLPASPAAAELNARAKQAPVQWPAPRRFSDDDIVPAPAPAPAAAASKAPAPAQKSLFDAKEGNWGDDSDSDDAPRERAEPAFEEKPAAEPAEKPARWPRAQAPRKSPRAAKPAKSAAKPKTGAKPKPAPTNPAAATAPTKSVPQFKTAKAPRGKKKKSDPAFDRAGFERRGFGIFEG